MATLHAILLSKTSLLICLWKVTVD
jgi:hypothetical protein